MNFIVDHPFLVLVLCLVMFYVAERIGASFRRKLEEDERENLSLIVAASLTLLGLIIGFTFSMAVSRYDQRKNYEAIEFNTIRTEYNRSDFLPTEDAARVRALLRAYLDQRILFYETRNDRQLPQMEAATARLQTDLWSAVQVPALKQQTPVIALAASGMNEVLDSQGYTQAAYLNRIPASAWGLMTAISIVCNLLIGYRISRTEGRISLLPVLPLLVSISFFLIADIDSPHGGIVRVHPHNLVDLSQSLHAR